MFGWSHVHFQSLHWASGGILRRKFALIDIFTFIVTPIASLILLLQNEYRGLSYATVAVVIITLIYYGFNFIVDITLVFKYV